jgi:hypothetical protein
MKIDVDILTTPYTIREVDLDDSWDAGEDGLHVHGVTAQLTDKEYGWEVKELGPDRTVCVIVEHYSDGCTFGSSEYVETKGVWATEDLARAGCPAIPDHGYFGNHIAFLYFTVRVSS